MRVLQWVAVRLACWLLKLPLNIQERTRLTGAILESNNALPLSDFVSIYDNGSVRIGTQLYSYDEASNIRESARAALESRARRAISTQVESTASQRGIVEGDIPEKLYFYRAAIWWGRQEEEILERLARM